MWWGKLIHARIILSKPFPHEWRSHEWGKGFERMMSAWITFLTTLTLRQFHSHISHLEINGCNITVDVKNSAKWHPFFSIKENHFWNYKNYLTISFCIEQNASHLSLCKSKEGFQMTFACMKVLKTVCTVWTVYVL